MKLRKTAVLADLSRPRIGETSRPVASGVHVSPARRAMLGALGFTPVHRNDGRGLEPRPSHPTEERTLDGLDAA
jgi:hypothetical protein